MASENNRTEALRIVARFLFRCSIGEQFTEQEYKLMSDLCFLALPMRHRMDREEKARLEHIAKQDKTKHLRRALGEE